MHPSSHQIQEARIVALFGVLDIPQPGVLDLSLESVLTEPVGRGRIGAPGRRDSKPIAPASMSCRVSRSGTSSQRNGITPTYRLTASSICSSNGWWRRRRGPGRARPSIRGLLLVQQVRDRQAGRLDRQLSIGAKRVPLQNSRQVL